ncbi:hypothetical protein [Hyphomicrobium methylovorum]|uniref:hypothetical protein n=1 Tax=Hyphomicrobium methylovorum TaxID=84 RepID=UPI0015E678FB|nr:hypothetical protein [Hyphomicrobium methylovorum]
MSADKPKPLEHELPDVERRENKPADEKPPKFQPTDDPDDRTEKGDADRKRQSQR